MTAHNLRQSVTISQEPRDELYRAILRESLQHCLRFSLVQATDRSIHDSAKLILSQLSPHLATEQIVSEWPGTRLLKGTATLRQYELCEASLTTLERAAQGFYDWCQPERPEDLVFWRPSNEPWLVTITHEQDAYFEVTPTEQDALVRAIPDLLSLIVIK
jgi:hypothetical protein